MTSPTEDKDQRHQTPYFGRLLVVCVATIIFCGVLVWLTSTYLQDCCTFDFFTRLGR